MAITKVPKIMTDGLENVDNTSDANKPVSTATQNALDLKVDETAGTLTSGSIITPARLDAKQDVKANLQTYAATATNGQFAFATDEKKMYQIVDNNLVDVGSGTGGINYILNSDFENGIDGWSTYKDAAQESPVDGIGGVADITFDPTTTTPLRGDQSGLLDKNSGLSRQGEGVSYDFTIDSADQAQVLRVSFDYSTSNNYADGYVRVYVYDVTNSRLIEVIDRDLYASTLGKFVGTFQTSPDSTNYRLILHIATEELATDWSVKIDNVIVGPQTIVKGAIVKEQYAYLTLGSLAVGTVVGALTGSEGEGLFSYNSATGIYTALKPINVQASFTARATGTTLPVAPTIIFPDNSFVTTSSDAIATAWATASGLSFVNPGETFNFSLGGNTSSTNRISVVATYVSPNVTLSEDAGNREIAFRATLNSAANHTVLGGYQKMPFTSSSINYDTATGWDSVNNRYVIQETGLYDIIGNVSFTSIASTFGCEVAIFVDNNRASTGSYAENGAATGGAASITSATLRLNKGQFVELRAFQNESSSESYLIDTFRNIFTITKRSSPQTIAASERISARAENNSGQQFTDTSTVVLWDTITRDDVAMINTNGDITIKSSGIYDVSAFLTFNSLTRNPSAGRIIATFQVNGSGGGEFFIPVSDSSVSSFPFHVRDTISLNKGDVLRLRVRQNSITAPNNGLRTTVGNNFITITRIK